MSAAHGAGVTFAVAAEQTVGCDVELAVARSTQEWTGLLGAVGFALASLVAHESGEDLAVAATRVWCAQECLRKAGYARAELVEVSGPRTDQWVVLCSGTLQIATFRTSLHGLDEPVVFAMLTDRHENGE